MATPKTISELLEACGDRVSLRKTSKDVYCAWKNVTDIKKVDCAKEHTGTSAEQALSLLLITINKHGNSND